ILMLRGEKRTGRVLGSMLRRSVDQYWKMIVGLRAYRQEVFEAMETAGVGAMLCPAMATPAVPHGLSTDFTLAASYTMLYNLVQFPAGIVPVTRARADDAERPAPQDKV